MIEYIKSKGWIYDKEINKGYGAYKKDNFFLVNFYIEPINYIGVGLLSNGKPVFQGEVNTLEQFDKLELLLQNKL